LTNVLLSVKPQYAHKILEGSKKFEFRKTPIRRLVDKVYIYSSSPEKKIIGYFHIKRIHSQKPAVLWDMCKDAGGIEKNDFFDYYSGKEVGHAIEISDVGTIDPFSPKAKNKHFIPPQSYRYIEDIDEI